MAKSDASVSTRPSSEAGEHREDLSGEQEPVPLYQLGYVSTQARPMATADLIKLLNVARDANRERGITGLLLHRQDSFFQVIEGDKDVILALFAQIESDPRHQRIEILFQGPIQEREYAEWEMGFVDLDGIDITLLPGFSKFLLDEEQPRQFLRDLSRSQRLALLFRAMP
jgi:hypothetical protein